MGMPTPISIWFRGNLAGWVAEQLRSETLRRSELFAPGYVESALAEHASGHRDRNLDLWKLLSVGSWWRIFIEGNTPSESHVVSPIQEVRVP